MTVDALFGVIVGALLAGFFAPWVASRQELGREHRKSTTEGERKLTWFAGRLKLVAVGKSSGQYAPADLPETEDDLCVVLAALLGLKLPTWRAKLLLRRLVDFAGSDALTVWELGCPDELLGRRRGFDAHMLHFTLTLFELKDDNEASQWLSTRAIRFQQYRLDDAKVRQIVGEIDKLRHCLSVSRLNAFARKTLRSVDIPRSVEELIEARGVLMRDRRDQNVTREPE